MAADPHYFLGIKVDDKVRNELKKWQETLSHHMEYKTWTSPLDLHITLKFLGPCTDKQIETWKQHLIQQEWPSRFSVRVGPAGSFGKKDEPRVFHAQVTKEPTLISLKERIDQIGEKIGFNTEKRPYSPHITLAKKRLEGRSPISYPNYESVWDETYPLVVDRFSIFRIHPQHVHKYEEVETIGLNSEV